MFTIWSWGHWPKVIERLGPIMIVFLALSVWKTARGFLYWSQIHISFLHHNVWVTPIHLWPFGSASLKQFHLRPIWYALPDPREDRSRYWWLQKPTRTWTAHMLQAKGRSETQGCLFASTLTPPHQLGVGLTHLQDSLPHKKEGSSKDWDAFWHRHTHDWL